MFRPSFIFKTARWIQTGIPTVYKPRRERLINPTLVVVGFIPVLTFSLGVWQLQRLRWKVNLIDELQEKLHYPPLPLPNHVNLDMIPEFAFRKVVLTGKWDHAHEMVVEPRVRQGIHGAHVITPLVRKDGTTILVDRGFISEVCKNSSFDRPTGEIEVLGLLRTAPRHNIFTPKNVPEEGKWHWIDIHAMAEHAGGESASVQPVLIEEIFESHSGDASLNISKGVPVGRPPSVDLRNAHLSYVITWFSLSALTSAMFLRVLINRKSQTARSLPRVTQPLRISRWR